MKATTALNLNEFQSETQVGLCQHCGEVVPIHRNDAFCCAGCSAVFKLLHSSHLDDYYRIRDQSGNFRKPTPVHPLSETVESTHPYLYLDEPRFRDDLGIALTSPKIQFYLEGIHCTACLWLIEKLPDLIPDDVLTARLDLQNSTAEIELREKGSISNVADLLDHLGYRPHPIFSSQEKDELQKKESRQFLAKLALAGAMTGNIMIFAISIYAGAEGFLKQHFDQIIFLLALPVIFYSALPLYQGAWSAIRNRRWSVDIPIVVALVAGFLVSTWSVFTGGDQNYFDSLTGLVFLLLGSRYFLMRLQKNAFEGLKFSESFYPVKILRNENEYVWVKDLRQGDVVEVPAGLRIPVDGVVVRGKSFVNESLLSGESLPKPVSEHEAVFAGTFNTDGTLWIKVTATGDQSRIGAISKQLQKVEMNQNDSVKMAELVAKGFTLSVIAWSVIVLAYFIIAKHAPAAGVERILSILIVSCPCAFAIATPLALIQAFQLLMKRGVYLKNPNEIEKLSEVKQIAFDKTGTLTQGVLEVQSVRWNSSDVASSESLYLPLIEILEKDSKHPIAKALLRYIERKCASFSPNSALVSDRNEISGEGVSGIWENRKIEVKRIESNQSQSELIQSGFYVDGVEIARFSFQDQIRSDSKKTIKTLSDKYPVWMLSGDRSLPVRAMAQSVGVQVGHSLPEMSPESKATWLKHHPGTLYVGDGANDGLALKEAHIGIAANGALDMSMKAASVYLIQNSLQGVLDLFTVAEETKIILKRHLIFTIFYNSSTITLASMGLLKPLLAAVLMPASSVLVLVSTQFGTKRLREMK